MNAMTASEVFAEIQKSATCPETRFVRTIRNGEYARQGDIYIVRVTDKPSGLKETMNRQLAPGSSKGSRHMVNGKVKVYEPDGKNPLHGPLLIATDRFTIEHPEHAHVSLPPGNYRVTYQRDFAKEESARVQD